MPGPDLSSLHAAYRQAITEIRSRLPDNQIVDVLERYVAGGYDRDEAMDALGIDHLGTLYTAVAVYRIERPEPNPQEEERQAKMMRMLLDGEEVPAELRQPASWRIRH
ncbi:hypothetical protein AB4Z52_13705 [Rhizobium sp. 2YAF20]|uniref:hypothetical protein n=1 Tax=Rhizobium sp. 2YAF20 TaxID=3233027 RepID=UPI003F95D9D9